MSYSPSMFGLFRMEMGHAKIIEITIIIYKVYYMCSSVLI